MSCESDFFPITSSFQLPLSSKEFSCYPSPGSKSLPGSWALPSSFFGCFLKNVLKERQKINLYRSLSQKQHRRWLQPKVPPRCSFGAEKRPGLS